MKRNFFLVISLFQLLVCLFAFASIATAEIRPGPNVNIVAADPYSQKQLEVDASANPRNPNHIFAGYIDYQTALTEAQRVTSKGRCGYSFSTNGGKTWKNGLLPLLQSDVDKCGDPAVAWDTNGHVFYFALSMLTDGVTTFMTVWRLTDPDDGSGRLISDPPVTVDLGNTGQDLDKGSITFQPDPNSQNPNAPGTLYVCYSIFTGGAQNNLKITCAISRDGGNTYTKPNQGKYNGNLNSNNGTAAAAGPNGGIYLFWRAFTGTENGYYFVKVEPNGNATPPVRIVGGSGFYPYDPPTGSNLARSNAFPAPASDGGQKLMLAFQAYSDSNGFMAPPSLSNTPRIFVTYSTNGGGAWSTPRAVDYGPHLNTHQFMPRAAYAGGQWSIIYYDGRYDNCFEQEPANPALCGRNLNVIPVNGVNFYFPTGKDRRFDLRVVQGQFDATGNLNFSLPSTQVTIYETRKDTNEIVQRDGANCIPPGCPALNYPFLPVGSNGLSSWMGDYIAHIAKVQFLRNPSGPSLPAWRFANQPGDPTTVLAFWADFREVAFPLTNGNPDINGNWTQWIPAGLAGCINPKTRDVNVLFSEIDSAGLSASVRSTAQRQGIPPDFNVNIQNLSGRDLFLRLQIVDSTAEDWSAVQTLPVPAAIPADDNFVNIKLLKNSSVTKSVYYRWRSGGTPTPTQPVLVKIYETTGLPNGAPGGTIVPDGLNANVTYALSSVIPPGGSIHGVSVAAPTVSFGMHTEESFTYKGQPSNNLIENNLIENNLIENNLIENNLIENNLIENNLIENNLIENGLIEDQQVVWTVTGTGALTTAATAFNNVANGQALLEDGWVFQLLVYQTQLNPKVFECTQLPNPTDVVLSNIAITTPNGFFPNTDNFQVSNNLIENNLIENNLIENSPISDQVSNATFPLDLQEQVHIALRAFKPPDSSMSVEIFNPNDDDQIGQAVFGQARDPLTGALVADFFDTTPPVITYALSPLPNPAGWHKTSVTVTWTLRDSQSGIQSSTGCGVQTLGSETPATGTVLTCQATNYAGLSNSVSVTLKIDKTNPTATITHPANGASYVLNSSVAAVYSCSDALSGIAASGCNGTVPNGSNFSTNTIGPKTFSVTATDIAGNTATVSSTYYVTYNFIPTPPKSPANLGSAVPLNWQLRDGQNNPINNLNTLVKMESVFNGPANGGCTPSLTGPRETLYNVPIGATGGSDFRLVSGGYRFNWDSTTATTAPLITGKGCYTILISLNDLSAPKMMTVELK